MHRMYGFRNCSSPYVINSNLYIRILVTVRCFHSCRHIPQLFYLQPHPARSKHMCRWYQKFVHNILTLLLDPQALCPPPPFLPQFVLFINTKKAGNLLDAFCLCRHIPFLYYPYYIFIPCSLVLFLNIGHNSCCRRN